MDVLGEIYKCSQQLGDKITPSGFNRNNVDWEYDPELNNIVPLKDGKKPRKAVVPDLRRNGLKPILFADTAEYLFALGDRGKERQPAWIAAMQQCFDETVSEVVKQVIEQICNNPPDIPEEMKPGDRVVITINGDYIHERPELREYWVNAWSKEQESAPGQCIVTGKETNVLKNKMPYVLKGVPGANTSGALMTSNDKPAFDTHGLQGMGNAPISIAVSSDISQTLQYLISNPSTSYRLGYGNKSNQMYVFLGLGINPDSLNDRQIVATNQLFVSATTGKVLAQPPESVKLLRLKGNAGRVSIVECREEATKDIYDNVNTFYSAQIYGEDIKPLPKWKMLELLVFDTKSEHTQLFNAALLNCGLFGKPLPICILQNLLHRTYVACDPNVIKNAAKLISLYFKVANTSMEHNKDLSTIAQAIGRMAYVCHQAQISHSKIDGSNTNVIRSLKSLASNPGYIFNRIYTAYKTYYSPNKFLQARMDRAVAMLPEGFSFSDIPSSFDPVSQSDFMLGFAIEEADYWAEYRANNPDKTNEQTGEDSNG